MGRLAVQLLYRYLHFYKKIYKKNKTFVYRKREIPYLYHFYNSSWDNERCVEIPLAWQMVQEYKEKEILELGNVLSHYFPITHEVVDKYEKGKGVINEDVVTFQPGKLYDLIVSVSTLEHVGWDEKPREPEKVEAAIKHLLTLLKPNGLLFFTFPLGHNPCLDELVLGKKLKLTEVTYLRRISEDNEWREAEENEVKNAKYGEPFINANVIAVCKIEK